MGNYGGTFLMIKTAKQLKDLIRNIADGDSGKSQRLIRNYAMERFLERITISKYKDNFILKGGMLVSSIVGLNNRATMDIDTTLRNLPLDTEAARKIVEEISAIEVDDRIRFSIKNVSSIMDEAEYSGVRLSLIAFFDTMSIPLKIDISTGDVITPVEITYRYKLMFEQRYISLWAYPLETVLAEKIETVLTRSIFNTRLRDFYDLYILQNIGLAIDTKTLSLALKATCQKRGSEQILLKYQNILNEIQFNSVMQKFWENYQNKNRYAAGIEWETVMDSIRTLCNTCILPK